MLKDDPPAELKIAMVDEKGKTHPEITPEVAVITGADKEKVEDIKMSKEGDKNSADRSRNECFKQLWSFLGEVTKQETRIPQKVEEDDLRERIAKHIRQVPSDGLRLRPTKARYHDGNLQVLFHGQECGRDRSHWILLTQHPVLAREFKSEFRPGSFPGSAAKEYAGRIWTLNKCIQVTGTPRRMWEALAPGGAQNRPRQ